MEAGEDIPGRDVGRKGSPAGEGGALRKPDLFP